MLERARFENVLTARPESAAPPVVSRSDRRIVRAGTVRTIDAAQQALHEQQERQHEQQSLERQLEEARRVGHAAGVRDTLAQGTAAVLRAADALDALHQHDTSRQERQQQEVSDTVLTLALQVAGWALHRELAEDSGRGLLARLEAGLTALLPSPTTRISVSHEDHPLIAEWAERRGRVGTTVVADQRLAPGDAVVATDAGRAEVTVAAALHAAAEALGLPVDAVHP